MKPYRFLFLAGAFLAAVVGAAEAPSPMADLVDRMPADRIPASQTLVAQMLQLGPAGIGELIRMLRPPGAGDDRKARLALDSLASYMARPGAEKERRMFSGVLLKALQGPGDSQVKAFLRGLLQRVIEAEARSPDPEVRYAAARMASDWLNLARGKPVATSVPQQGNQAPALAVDGNSGDLASSWWGANWPAWFQVDLEGPVRIDTVQVFFYWDGQRSYRYTVEVSPDGQSWRTVADRSRNIRPATPRGVAHHFDPTLARYVRLNILHNSANEAVHLVELKVFAVGTAPPLALSPPRPKPDREGFVPLFNGRDLTGWVGSTQGYVVEDGILVCLPEGGGLLRTEEQYGDFILRFEFRLTPNANNGVGIRFTEGNPAYSGMEIQILDDSGDQYRNLQPYQYHGSIYGVVPCKRGHQKPVGEWNSEEIIANGRRITVILNGVPIVDADLDQVLAQGPADHQDHPGLKNEKGFIGFLGHGSRVEFRNIRLKELKPTAVKVQAFTTTAVCRCIRGTRMRMQSPSHRQSRGRPSGS